MGYIISLVLRLASLSVECLTKDVIEMKLSRLKVVEQE